MTDTPDIPIFGVADLARACRLALAVLDDDPARYNAAMTDAKNHIPELIHALAANWTRALFECDGPRARARIEQLLLNIAEYYELSPGHPNRET